MLTCILLLTTIVFANPQHCSQVWLFVHILTYYEQHQAVGVVRPHIFSLNIPGQPTVHWIQNNTCWQVKEGACCFELHRRGWLWKPFFKASSSEMEAWVRRASVEPSTCPAAAFSSYGAINTGAQYMSSYLLIAYSGEPSNCFKYISSLSRTNHCTTYFISFQIVWYSIWVWGVNV